MGDRAHAVVKNGKSKVYLYTHWGATELPETVRAALRFAKESGRLQDGAYLARIVFSTMTRGSEQGATGFGIGSEPMEDTSRDITIDVDAQTIKLPHKSAVAIDEFVK